MILRASMLALLLLAGCGRTDLIEGVSGDGGTDAVQSGCTAVTTAEADAEWMRRWNVAVDAGTQTIDFHWRVLTDFPHPTYRMGNMVAYDEFADVLVLFWGDDSTVKFAGCHDLFNREYKSGPPVQVQKTVRLRPLTLEMSSSSLIDAPRRAALVRACMIIGC